MNLTLNMNNYNKASYRPHTKTLKCRMCCYQTATSVSSHELIHHRTFLCPTFSPLIQLQDPSSHALCCLLNLPALSFTTNEP